MFEWGSNALIKFLRGWAYKTNEKPFAREKKQPIAISNLSNILEKRSRSINEQGKAYPLSVGSMV